MKRYWTDNRLMQMPTCFGYSFAVILPELLPNSLAASGLWCLECYVCHKQ